MVETETSMSRQSQTLEAIPWTRRDFLPDAIEVDELTAIASQPGNHKSRKPALFILLYASGKSKAAIKRELRVSERSLHLWWTRWIEDGVDGLRYLSSTTKFDSGDPVLNAKVRQAIARIRAMA